MPSSCYGVYAASTCRVLLSSQALALPLDLSSKPTMLNGYKTKPKWNGTRPLLSCTCTGCQACQLVLGHQRVLHTRTQYHRHAAPLKLSWSFHRRQHQLLRRLLCYLCAEAYTPHAMHPMYVVRFTTWTTFYHLDYISPLGSEQYYQMPQSLGSVAAARLGAYQATSRQMSHSCMRTVKVMCHKHLPISVAW